MFEISKDLAALSDKVIAKFKELKEIAANNVRIAYLYSDREKTSNGKKVYADTTKLNAKVKAVASYDFIVTFYRPACSTIDESKNGNLDATRAETYRI